MPESGEAAGEADQQRRAPARGEASRVEASKGRLALARRFAEARATVPQLELSETIRLSGVRSSDRDLVAAVIAAVGSILVDHPRLNAAWRDGGIEQYSRRNLAVAAPSPDGAAWPTIVDADTKSSEQIATELEELGAAAAAGSLRAPQTAGATFSIHPPVGVGTLMPTPIGGHASALAIGEPGAVVLPRRGEAAVVEVTTICLACDGRAVLPAEAGAFLAALKQHLEG